MEILLLILGLLYGSGPAAPMDEPCLDDTCIVQTGPGTGG